jgi:hypothetical protein
MGDWQNYANGTYGRKAQKEFWRHHEEYKEMKKNEHKYMKKEDEGKPFYPGLKRDVDR